VRSQSPRRPSPEFGMKLPWRRCRHPYATRPTPKHMSSAAYNRIPAVTIYKTYPVYTPGREPDGHLDQRRRPGARNCVRPDRLHTAADWARAGEAIFLRTTFFQSRPRCSPVQSSFPPRGSPVSADGTYPFSRYVIRKKGGGTGWTPWRRLLPSDAQTEVSLFRVK
jgi:hypothetical protein